MGDISLFLILLFFAVLFISQALLLPVAGQKAKHGELTKRLKQAQKKLDEESLSLLHEYYLKEMTPFERRIIKIPIFANLKKMVELSGLSVTLGKLLSWTLFSSLLVGLISFALGQLWYINIGLFFGVWILVYTYIQKCITKRLQKFEEQLPDTLDIIKRVLQAGQTINQAFKEVGEEMPDPIGIEFKKTFNLLNFGYDLRLAILQMVDRTPTISMLAFSSAVILQKETGGNLTENLDKVSRVLRARFKLSRKIKTLSAEARLSSWILVLSPFALYLLIMVINPEHAELLITDPRGISAISMGIMSLAVGSLWIRKIINIKV
ncbi:type II secretion system F family protein [Vibrio breoganii]|uniref:type II secretion system F family protein n=1 Tax=Vibrio breoganii TaxID=553239 RepID=UPI000318A04A|nr:type II secretion system F family protein [Vibrio breoganii]OED94526.1 pilus assembly protein TadB [Vibrio breoganii ZF-29]OEF82762.1 pilus assembly protein TadB [Vibrio breoganii 1C10]PMG99273.1 pilus assembly protein TadB [Vibrio breoganii]PML12883.1 pilus assembly protein TadB [Vibrio breoganii]PML28620.1 pilus assembly protein TadB [Vibrio breoganii]